MIDPALIACGGSVLGGVVLKTAEHYLSKSKESVVVYSDMFEYRPPTKAEIYKAILNSYNKARQTPLEAIGIVARIGRLVQEIFPLLPRIGEASEERYNFYNVAQVYLPDALDSYNKLDPAWRDTEPVHEGQTASELLIEQLLNIEKMLISILDSANDRENREEATDLIVNALFIRGKVDKSDL